MSQNSIFDAFNRLIERTITTGKVKDYGESRFYVPSGSFTPTSALLGADIKSFHGADALQISTVYACIAKISDEIASMDVIVERKTKQGDIEPIENHPLSYLMTIEPNELMGAFELKQMMVSDMLLYGVGYGYIDSDSDKVYWLPASDVTYAIDKNTGEKFYHYPGAPTPVPSSNVLEFKAFRTLSPTRAQLKTLTTAKSLMDFGNKFFENGGMLGGLLTTKEPLDTEQMRQMTDFWKERYSGAANAHKVAILGGGFTYQPLSVPLDQLQYIDSKKYSSEEICRVYQMPPAMVGIENNTSYNSYEQQVLQYMQGCIAPKVKAIELELSRKLLPNQKDLNVRLNIDSMIRADYSAKAEYYGKLLQNGVMTINEVRRREGLMRIDSGDNNFVQVNQIPVAMAQQYAESIITDKSKDPNTDKSKIDNQAGALANDNEVNQQEQE